MPTLKIDGHEVTVEKDRTVIQACEQLGIDVPRYCYHPGLKVVGSCRMCLVDVEKMPKMQIACNTPANDDMVVWTHTDKVKEARRSVLEFLLLNHPLDCPVCDRAGECELQNYYMQHAQHNSRLTEDKNKKLKAFPIGPRVMLDQERCVLCSRCVRFTSDVTKTGELGIFNRGTWSEINVVPGKELNNNYSGNVVDICPVGALLDRDFRYKMSVWYLKESVSVCPGCSNGCNIKINYNLDRSYKIEGRRILRLKPRFNDQVNGYWMCDEGRYNYGWIDIARIPGPLQNAAGSETPGGRASLPANLVAVEWSAVLAHVAERLKATIDTHGKESVAVIVSPQMTNEELFAARRLFYESLGIAEMPFLIPPNPKAVSDNMLLKKDKNPNTRGAELIFPEQKGRLVKSVMDSLVSGEIKFLYVFHSNVLEDFGAAWAGPLLDQVETLVYHGSNVNPTMERAHVVLPAAVYAEKEGTFTNHQGRVQRIFAAVPPMKQSHTTLEILRDLSKALNLVSVSPEASEAFGALASSNPAYSGLTYANIGLSGKLVNQPEPAVAAD